MNMYVPQVFAPLGQFILVINLHGPIDSLDDDLCIVSKKLLK